MMDIEVEKKEEMSIRNVIQENEGGDIEVKDIKKRIEGRVKLIEFKIVVEEDMRVGDENVICERIEDEVKEKIGNERVVINVEKEDEDKIKKGKSQVKLE